MTMVNCLMRTIALDIFGTLNITNSHSVFPFPAVFTLWDIWVYICTMYYNNETSYIEVSVDDRFGFGTVLSVPNIDPNNGHIWFQRNFNNSRPRSKNNVVENVVVFENFLDIFRRNVWVWLFINIWDIYNFEVKFWLREPRGRNLIRVVFFFFLNQQFITQCAKTNRGSYFCNYIQKTHTNMKLKVKKEKEKEKGN